MVAHALEAVEAVALGAPGAIGFDRLPIDRMLEAERLRRRNGEGGRDRPQDLDGVVPLLVRPLVPDERFQGGDLGRRKAESPGVGEEAVPAPFRVEAELGSLEQSHGLGRSDMACLNGGAHAIAQVHHRGRGGDISALRRAVRDRDLVIVVEDAAGEVAEDRADSDHSEGMELGGAQRAHAAAPVDGHAAVDREQYLLVPDRRDALEQAVDHGDRARPLLHGPIDVAHLHRRTVIARADGAGGVEIEAWAEEDDGQAHKANSRASRRARSPRR